MKHSAFLSFLAGILENVTKRISTPHGNLCCRPAPNLQKKKKFTQPQKEEKQTPQNALLAACRLLWTILTRRNHSAKNKSLHSTFQKKKKLLLQSGLKLWAGHQTLWLMGRLLRRRGLGLIGTRVFKGTDGEAWGLAGFIVPKAFYFYIKKMWNPISFSIRKLIFYDMYLYNLFFSNLRIILIVTWWVLIIVYSIIDRTAERELSHIN